MAVRDIADDAKLAGGHALVLLSAASAGQAGHPDADRLLGDAAEVPARRLRAKGADPLCGDRRRGWTPLSTPLAA